VQVSARFRHMDECLEMAMSHGLAIGALIDFERPAGRHMTPPALSISRHRYSCDGDSSDNEHDGSPSLSPTQDVATPLAQAGHEHGGLHTATRVFLAKFGASRSQHITVEATARELSIPVTDTHALLAVLEVLEVRAQTIHVFVRSAPVS
jgi:hypothetical protein